MSKFVPKRPSPALVLSFVALLVALGGTAYAGVTLGKNSVGSSQLKANAVTTSKIKNGAVTTAKLKNHAVTASKINTTGLTVPNALHAGSADTATDAINATNATNATNAATVTGQGTLASGHTEIGIIGGRFQNGTVAPSAMAATVTFPLLAPVALTNSHIEVAPSAQCTGTTSDPTAAAGFVCIYPDITVSADTITGDTGVTGDTKLGFQMDWNATATNAQSSVRAEWAYTAP